MFNESIIHINREFHLFLKGGLPILGFSVISSSILKISVPIFRNTPNFCILDEFEGSYGCFFTKHHFFGTRCTVHILTLGRSSCQSRLFLVILRDAQVQNCTCTMYCQHLPFSIYHPLSYSCNTKCHLC